VRKDEFFSLLQRSVSRAPVGLRALPVLHELARADMCRRLTALFRILVRTPLWGRLTAARRASCCPESAAAGCSASTAAPARSCTIRTATNAAACSAPGACLYEVRSSFAVDNVVLRGRCGPPDGCAPAFSPARQQDACTPMHIENLASARCAAYCTAQLRASSDRRCHLHLTKNPSISGRSFCRGANCQVIYDDCGNGGYCLNGGSCDQLLNTRSSTICLCPPGVSIMHLPAQHHAFSTRYMK